MTEEQLLQYVREEIERLKRRIDRYRAAAADASAHPEYRMGSQSFLESCERDLRIYLAAESALEPVT